MTQILKAKTEPASNRIMRLLDRLSAYSFNLYYLKGKDMILTDYLSRNHHDNEDPAELIPVSFCKIRDIEDFCVATRASVKASGETACQCKDYIPRKVYGSRGPRMFNSENVISLDGKGVTVRHLFDKTEVKVFFDSGASMSYMSKGFYEKTEYLHRIPKMKSSCTGIKIGNGAVIPVDFVFPVQIMIQGHLIEIYTIVAALHESIDVVIGMKNMVELEGILNTRTSSFDFLSRSIPIHPLNDLKVKPGGKAYIKIVAPFQKQINTRAIANLLRVIK